MNLTQIHERLRLELLRRIQRGSLSVSLLARQTGFGQSHMSSFLRSRSQLSLEAMDRVLAAQHLTAEELLPVLRRPGDREIEEGGDTVPLVSHHAALFEPYIRPSAAQEMVHLSAGRLASFRTRVSATRRAWERFIAVRLSAADAQGMEPLLLPDAIAVVDRHYNLLAQHRADRANLYAVKDGARLRLRHVEFTAGRLVLRPLSLAFAVELIELDAGASPSELIVGRVVVVINET